MLRNVPLPEPHLVGIAAGIGLHQWRPWTIPGSRHLHRLIGYPLIATGTCIIAQSLHTARSTEIDRPDRLLTTGPYAVSRNPMYAGWTLLQLGIGITSGSAWTLAALPAVTASIHREIMHEERVLSEMFGDEYDRYRATVPRYLRLR